MAADPFFRVEGASVRYGPIQAVRGVSLHVEQGEIVVLLGANGAGKTSLMSAVAGLVPLADGSVTLEGRRLDRLAPERVVRHGIALVPEGRRVFARLTVAENLRLGGVPCRDHAARDATLRRVLELFPVLAQRATQAAGTLSGGQQQMLAVGRALMSRPKLLLLDEPSLGLAPIVVDQIFDLLAELRRDGTTLLIVEQNVHRSLELADRAYVLVNGRIENEGRAEELRRTPGIERAYLGVPA